MRWCEVAGGAKQVQVKQVRQVRIEATQVEPEVEGDAGGLWTEAGTGEAGEAGALGGEAGEAGEVLHV